MGVSFNFFTALLGPPDEDELIRVVMVVFVVGVAI